MSKSISKEMWQELEKEMSGMFVNVEFGYQGHIVTIQRQRQSESKTLLIVYLDGVIKAEWALCDESSRPSIFNDIWMLKRKAKYSQGFIKSLEKTYGKRVAKKEWPDLHDKKEFRSPYFPKASSLCRQLKKLKGLELIAPHGIGGEL
ncbi:hypothetical protein [Aliivibrio wodanis]|uniref:hypothetical protein n=1 Tax=Aliivibrio wodanis TaxID=80852 RepID=UPI00406C66F1